jgi:hypothetical protein
MKRTNVRAENRTPVLNDGKRARYQLRYQSLLFLFKLLFFIINMEGKLIEESIGSNISRYDNISLIVVIFIRGKCQSKKNV